SYGALARQLGRPKSVRAVGLANGANPVAIVVPCHRVIGTDGSLTGYGGGISRMRWLLIHEGVALKKSATRQMPEAA
ncbi:MAG: MGMT family protein, partial [Xanthobacteraceae bacterium]